MVGLHKALKRFTCVSLAMMLILASVVVTSQEVAAVSRTTTRVRCGVGMRNSSGLSISLWNRYDSIRKLRSSSKNLVVGQTYRYNSNSSNSVTLSFYAKKAGNYTIKYDLHNSSGRRYASRTIRVRASGTGSVINGVKVNGKNVLSKNAYSSAHYTTRKKAKVRFSLAPGCKIRRIQVARYNRKGINATKNFKNGKSVTLGTYGYSGSNSGGTSCSPWNSWTRNFYAPTEFRITYRDTFTNTTGTTYFTLYRRATRW